MAKTFEGFMEAWNAPLCGREDVEEHPYRLIHAAKQLGGREREQAVRFLCDRIRSGRALLPAIVAGGAELKGTVGALEAALQGARGWEKAEVAKALGRLTGRRGRTARALVEAAQDGSMDAVIALAEHRGEAVIGALIEALEAEDSLIRHHASDSLLVAAGFSDHRGVGFGRVRAYLGGLHPALRRYGLKCFRLLRQLKVEGAPYGELGEELLVTPRSETLNRFFERLHPETGERVVDRRLLGRLTRTERLWVEFVLLSGFFGKLGRVGLVALEEIGAGPSYSVLSDALEDLKGRDRQVARRVLRALERRKPSGSR